MALRVVRDTTKQKIVIPPLTSAELADPKRLKQVLKEVEKNVRDLGSDSLVEEMRGQAKKYRSYPSSLVLDNKTVVPLNKVQSKRLVGLNEDQATILGWNRNIRAFYTDMGVLLMAVTFAWERLRAILPEDSGDAKYEMNMFCVEPVRNPGGGRICRTIAQVKDFLGKAEDPMTRVVIAGPFVEYRRDVIYNANGRKQQNTWTRLEKSITKEGGHGTDRWRFSSKNKEAVAKKGSVSVRLSRRGKVYVQTARAAHWIVRQQIRRQYRDIYSSYRFAPSRYLPLPIMGHNNSSWRPSGQNVHIPILSLGLKKKVRGRQSFGVPNG